MECTECGKEIVRVSKENPRIHCNGKGTYLYCPSCQAKNYTESDSDNGGHNYPNLSTT